MWPDSGRTSTAIASATASTGTQPRRSASGIAARFAGGSMVVRSTAFTGTVRRARQARHHGPGGGERPPKVEVEHAPPHRRVGLEEPAGGEAAHAGDQD